MAIPWSQALQHRTTDVELTIRRLDGSPLARREVVVAQRSHAFRFGCTGFEAVDLAGEGLDDDARAVAERVLASWLELFNTATLPFYWARFEPQRGLPDTRRLLAAARWFRDRGCTVKGHPLCWHTLAPDWLLPLPTGEVEEVLRARITREVTDAAGLIDTWDAINEAVIMPVFDRQENAITRLCRELGRVETVRLAFDTARRANPRATLLLNDFDMSADYEQLIEACLEAGVAIDALGLQSHMHQGYWGIEKTLDVLERFARFGLPLHFTENTIVSGQLMPPEIVDLNDYQVASWPSTPEGEARQADEVVAHYTTLLAHPAVASVTWWGLPDGGWLNAPSGLVRADGTPKPAFDALHDLVKGDWWLAPARLMTDDDGRLEFTGFLGEYECSWGGASTTVVLDRPGPCTMDARLGT
jgi:endo-1,4-beta-xylanase